MDSQPAEHPADQPEIEHPEVIPAGIEPAGRADDEAIDESIEHPAKVMRVGTMMKQLLEEVRSATLDEASRDRLKEIYDTSVAEIGSALSEDLRDELSRLALPFAEDRSPSAAELQIGAGNKPAPEVDEIAGDGDLVHRIGQLAPLEPEA